MSLTVAVIRHLFYKDHFCACVCTVGQITSFFFFNIKVLIKVQKKKLGVHNITFPDVFVEQWARKAF